MKTNGINILRADIVENIKENPLDIRLRLSFFNPELEISQFVDNRDTFLNITNDTLDRINNGIIEDEADLLVSNAAKITNKIFRFLAISNPEGLFVLLEKIRIFRNNKHVKKLFKCNKEWLEERCPGLYDNEFHNKKHEKIVYDSSYMEEWCGGAIC